MEKEGPEGRRLGADLLYFTEKKPKQKGFCFQGGNLMGCPSGIQGVALIGGGWGRLGGGGGGGVDRKRGTGLGRFWDLREKK